MIHESILTTGLPTPVVRLSPRSTRGLACEVLVKLEGQLPSGTSAGRLAEVLIDEALDRAGEDRPTLVVGSQSGSAALAVAVVAAVRGMRLVAVVPDRICLEKLEVLRALGARLHLCPAAPPDAPESYRATAERLAAEIPGAVLVDPLCSDAAPEAQAQGPGREILEQLQGRLDLLVVPLESGSTATGLGTFLKKRIPGLRVVGAEPHGSLYADLFHLGRVGTPGSSLVEGSGSDRIAGTLDLALLDDVVQVPDPEALRMARRLARNEGILAGGAGGLAAAAAIELARELGTGRRVLAVLPDTGLYYVSRIYNEAWLQANQILGGATDRTLFDVLAAKKDDPGALQSITPEEPLSEAIARMKRFAISQLPVITRDGSPVGSLWEGMVIDLLVQGVETRSLTVREAMAEPFPIMEMETTVVEATRHFGPRVPALLVRRREGDFAIITKHDLLQGLTA